MDMQVSATEQEISRDTLLEKYAKEQEASVDDVRRRVARALAQAEPEDRRAHWERRFLQAQEEGFIPAGRINSAAGIQLQATLINCFVQPVGDSISEVVDGKPGIYTALQEAAETMRRGGDRKSTRLNSSHQIISYAVFCLKKKTANLVMHKLAGLPDVLCFRHG